MSINMSTGAAPVRWGPTQNQDRFEARCNEHNPYMTRCKRGHYQWGGNYCQTCGAPLRESLETKQ
jgi:hypothetical protein